MPALCFILTQTLLLNGAVATLAAVCIALPKAASTSASILSVLARMPARPRIFAHAHGLHQSEFRSFVSSPAALARSHHWPRRSIAPAGTCFDPAD